MRPQTLALAGLLVLAPIALPGRALAAEPKVRPQAYVSADAVAPGGTLQVAVRLAIEPHWHVQSHRPSEEWYIATELTLAPPESVTPATMRYPEGEHLDAPALGGILSVYNDGVIFGTDLSISASAEPGEHTIKAKVRYQACDDRTCLCPKTEALTFTFRIDPEATSDPRKHAEIFPDSQQRF